MDVKKYTHFCTFTILAIESELYTAGMTMLGGKDCHFPLFYHCFREETWNLEAIYSQRGKITF